MMTLPELRKRFVYTPDDKDDWHIMTNPVGYLKGDCEDFALTALWITAGCSKWRMWYWVTTGKARLWWCAGSKGFSAHMILYVDGLGWIDNKIPYWSPEPSTKPSVPWILPLFAVSMLFK